MAKFRQIYRCETCGNIVTVLDGGDGAMSCCGTPMTLIKPSDGPEGHEKHIPVVTVTNNAIEVAVGSVEHPMVDAHYIEWIELATANVSYRVFLHPGEAPKASFPPVDAPYLVSCYCNVHGLWDSLSGTDDAESTRKSIFTNN